MTDTAANAKFKTAGTFFGGARRVKAKGPGAAKDPAPASAVGRRLNHGDGAHGQSGGNIRKIGGIYHFVFPRSVFPVLRRSRMSAFGFNGEQVAEDGTIPAPVGVPFRVHARENHNLHNEFAPEYILGMTARYKNINGWRGAMFPVVFSFIINGLVDIDSYELVNDEDLDDLEPFSEQEGWEYLRLSANNLTEAVDQFRRLMGSYTTLFALSGGSSLDMGTSNTKFALNLTGYEPPECSPEVAAKWDNIYSCISTFSLSVQFMVFYNIIRFVKEWPEQDDIFLYTYDFPAEYVVATANTRGFYSLYFYDVVGGIPAGMLERAKSTVVNPDAPCTLSLQAFYPSMKEISEFHVLAQGAFCKPYLNAAMLGYMDERFRESTVFLFRQTYEDYPSNKRITQPKLEDFKFGRSGEICISNEESKKFLKELSQVIYNFAQNVAFEECRSLAGIGNEYSNKAYKFFEGCTIDPNWLALYAIELQAIDPGLAARLRERMETLLPHAGPAPNPTLAESRELLRGFVDDAQRTEATQRRADGEAFPKPKFAIFARR